MELTIINMQGNRTALQPVIQHLSDTSAVALNSQNTGTCICISQVSALRLRASAKLLKERLTCMGQSALWMAMASPMLVKEGLQPLPDQLSLYMLLQHSHCISQLCTCLQHVVHQCLALPAISSASSQAEASVHEMRLAVSVLLSAD